MNAKIRKMVDEFAHHMQVEVDRQKREQITMILRGFTFGDPLKASNGLNGHAKPKKRRKGPIQLCPVPKCKNRAAPVFGMVCGDHKGLPKAVLKRHRDGRRKVKLAAEAAERKRAAKRVPQKPTLKEPKVKKQERRVMDESEFDF